MPQGNITPSRYDEARRSMGLRIAQYSSTRSSRPETTGSSGGYESSLGSDNETVMRNEADGSVLDLSNRINNRTEDEENENYIQSSHQESSELRTKEEEMVRNQRRLTGSTAYGEPSPEPETSFRTPQPRRTDNIDPSEAGLEAARAATLAAAQGLELQQEAQTAESNAADDESGEDSAQPNDAPTGLYDLYRKAWQQKDGQLILRYVNILQSPNKMISFKLYLVTALMQFLPIILAILAIILIIGVVITNLTS